MPKIDHAGLAAAARTRASPQWYALGLVGLLGLSGILAFIRLDREGLGYPNYAATVLSMERSWHNFWYVSFDPSGFLAVDKPPLGFWIQALFVHVLGFGSWALLAPQALATVASVAVLALLVKRSHGPTAGLLAGLFLAVCPISVAVGRTNLLDSQLVLELLLAAWAMLHGCERGSWAWAMGGGALLGLACLTKGAQALVVAPALMLPVLFTSAVPPVRRLGLAALAVVFVVIVAFPWLVLVDHAPTTQRPYVGGSSVNSEWDLLVGYNGAQRLSGTANAAPTMGPSARWPGPPGPLRLLDRQLGDQIGWLLPLAFAGLFLGRGLTRRTNGAWWLWAGWAVVPGVLFSSLPAYLPYYVATMAPGLAALEGIGLAVLWERYRVGAIPMWRLPAVLAVTALVQLYLLMGFSSWQPWLGLSIAALVLAGCAALLGARRLPPRWSCRLSCAGGALALTGLLLAPGTWALTPVLQGLIYRDMPYAGPLPASAVSTHHAASMSDLTLVRFLMDRQSTARFLVATPDAYAASPFILATGRPVLTLGGYTGRETPLSLSTLGRLIGEGSLRYVLLPAGAASELRATGQPTTAQAVAAACQPLSPADWESMGLGLAKSPESRYPGYGWEMLVGLVLYDCGPQGSN